MHSATWSRINPRVKLQISTVEAELQEYYLKLAPELVLQHGFEALQSRQMWVQTPVIQYTLILSQLNRRSEITGIYNMGGNNWAFLFELLLRFQ